MALLKSEGGERRYSNASAEQGAVGHPNKALENVRRGQPMMADETESDGEEEEYSGCCLFQSRSRSRRQVKGARYSRLESDDDLEASAKPNAKAKLLKSRSVFTKFCCCCGPRGAAPTNCTTVEVRAVDTKQDRKWEVDVNEDYCKPSYWRQAVRKLASHGHVRRPSRGADWLSYDAHEYQMNFDDGCGGRDNCVSYLFTVQNDDSATRARAMQKFAANGATGNSPRSPVSPILSPLPVKTMSKEELGKSKESFVPIWQRRQGAPPVKLDLRQRSGLMD